jgi:hypothetical protein
MADLPGEPGWYRLTDCGWECVDDDQAEAEIADWHGWDLTYFDTAPAAMTETPLF